MAIPIFRYIIGFGFFDEVFTKKAFKYLHYIGKFVPLRSVKRYKADIAQLVERRIRNA
jgi:hypothetical protein